MTSPSILFIDLNNFSHYPTIPVGHLIAALRSAGQRVRLYSPLAIGVSGFQRQSRARRADRLLDPLRFWSAMTGCDSVRRARGRLRKAMTPRNDRVRDRIVAGFGQALDWQPDVVLVSAYTLYRAIVGDMARICRARGIPLIVGGPSFSEPAIARHWLELAGVSAVVAGEAEPYIADLTAAAAAGRPLDRFPGTSTAATGIRPPAAPLQSLDALPVPDYSDFPWQAYPLRIVPLMTSRGCGWGACQFCSDVTGVMGRTFRSQSLSRAVEVIGTLTGRHKARHMVFHDLKLNSNLDLWYGLLDRLPQLVRDPVWTCAVHVGNEADNGLGPEALRAARRAGLARVTTGLESGSQRVLNAMGKGTQAERVAAFCRDASNAGLSVRLTAIVGSPGETAADLAATTAFLRANAPHIERVMVNRFSIMLGTPLAGRIARQPERFPDIVAGGAPDLGEAIVPHRSTAPDEPGYYRALFRLLGAAHAINRRPLRAHAQVFDGVM